MAYFAFGFPCIAGVILFYNFDANQSGYAFQILHERMGLQSLGITFHLGLNGLFLLHFLPWQGFCRVWLPVW